MSLKKRKEREIVTDKIIIRSKGEFTVKRDQQIYGMNLETGEVRLAELIEQEPKNGLQVFKIVEKSMHIYLPHVSKTMAVMKFKTILNSAK